MAFQPFVIDEFPGLDTRDPLEATGAIDLYNVVSDRPGEIRTRDGYEVFKSLSTGSNYNTLEAGVAGGGHYLIAGDPLAPKSFAVSTAGVETASVAKGIYDTESFGDSSGGVILCAMADSSTMQFFNGSAFAAITYSGTNPIAEKVAVQQPDNRAVICGGALGGGSRVHFSDPDDYTTWNANNFVDLSPGDGEVITALVSWREMILAFKQTKIFVFYGNSTDGDGNPVFNYRTISGVGVAAGTGYSNAAVAFNGVYFYAEPIAIGSRGHSRAGLYFTDGVGVRRLTENQDALFGNADDLGSFESPAFLTLNHFQTVVRTNYANGRVYMSGFILNAGTPILACVVYDTKTDFLTIFRSASRTPIDVTGFDSNTEGVGPYFVSSQDGVIYVFTRDATSDNGTAINSVYRTGFRDLGAPGQMKKVRETLCWGSGTVNVQLSADFAALDTAASVVMGASASAPGFGRRRQAVRGYAISTKFDAPSGQWSLNRLVHNINAPARAAGKET